MKSDLFIGIDAGTTSVKGVLTDANGNVVSEASREYTLETGGVTCELEAEVYWEKTIFVIRDLLGRGRAEKYNIRALSFSSQGETLICVDRQGKPLGKAIVWLDNRSTVEAKEIEDHFGREEICSRTGQPHVQPLWPATRLLWLRKNDPSRFRNTHKFLLVEDYLIFRFTGKYITEQSLVSSTLYYDIRARKWWKEMLDYLEISGEMLPEVRPCGTSLGNQTEAAISETGLPEDILIVTGAYDHVAGAIGAANYAEGTVSETTGSSMAMVVTLDKPIDNFSLGLPMQCHAIEGKYLLLPYGQTAGLVLKWFREQFCGDETYDALISDAAKIPAGADGLTMLPHLSGSGSPEFEANAKGVVAGLSSATTKAHFTRAILESIACMIKRNLDALEKGGISVNEMRALGGGSKSDLWNQIKADLTNVKIVTVKGQETSAIGAAILAATGAGVFQSISCASQKMVTFSRSFTPDATAHHEYRRVYQRYVALSDQLQNYWQS